MAEILRLYPEHPTVAIDTETPRALDKECTRCPLSKRGVKTVCMGAEGVPGRTGGLLIVSDYPTTKEDRTGRPFSADAGGVLRSLLALYWKDKPYTLDNIVRCAPGEDVAKLEASVAACRGFLSKTFREVRPDRVFLMGKWSYQGVLGRTLQPLNVRKGYAWMRDGDRRVPVFFMINPVAATRNRFVRQWVEDDFRWAATYNPPPPPWDGLVKIVRTVEDALQAERELRAAEWVSFDVETAGLQWRKFQVVNASCTPKGSDDSWVWDPASLADAGLVEPLRRLLRDPAVKKIGANIKFDQHAAALGLDAPMGGVIGDVRLQRKLLDPDADADLGTMADLVGMGGHKAEAAAALVSARKRVAKSIKARDSKQLSFLPLDTGDVRRDVIDDMKPTDDKDSFAYGFLPRLVRSRYNARDTVSAARLQERLDALLTADAPALRQTWDNIVRPAALAIPQVEAWGVAANRPAILQFQAYLQAKLKESAAKLKHYGEHFNPDSTADVRKLLYDELHLEVTKVTDKGVPSTDMEALEDLRHQHPAVDAILENRHFVKLDGTYATGMLRHIRDDGRMHPSILLDGARSGRLSCQEPNLQNIPRDSDSIEGRMARDCFAAEPGKVLISLDYSQIELRIAAMLSGDSLMLQIFNEGGDFHRRTAEMIAKTAWGVGPEAVEKKHRTAAKAINFGLLYGQGDTALAANIGATKAEAGKIRQAVLGNFKALDHWIKERLQYARRNGHAWTWWQGQEARRRPLWRIADADDFERSKCENSAHNTPIQGTASDFCLASLVEVVRWIKSDGVPAKLVLPVHDALLIEADESAADEVAHTAREIMLSWDSMGVPLVVDVEVGPAWGSLSKYKSAA